MADFMSKIKSGFNKSVATVSTGSKNMVEKSKINTCIKNLENEIKELNGILGTKVYGFCVSNPTADVPQAEVASFCEEISSRYAQIEQYKMKIAELDAEMEQVRGNGAVNQPVGGVACPCGMVNAVGSKFCAGCGRPLE